MHTYDDINEVLQRMCPQGFALLRFEHGTEMLRLGARELISNPQLAYEALGPSGTKAFGTALLALGQQHVKVAERMLELAKAGEASTSAKACLHSQPRESDQ